MRLYSLNFRRIVAIGTMIGAPLIAFSQNRNIGQAGVENPGKIHISTRLVQIGVIVHNKDGPVAGLTKEDFTIFDRGKAQPISVFSATTYGAAEWPAEPLPPNTFSDLPKYNPAAPGSITIVLLDNLNTLYGSAPGIFEDTPYWMEDHALTSAKAHLLEYLQRLGPHDRVALYGLTDKLHVLCDFTTDRERLLSIVQRYDSTSRTSREVAEPGRTRLPQQVKGLEPPPIDSANLELAEAANSVRAGTTMAALKSIADHLANIPGRKNLVWLTANVPVSGEAIAALLGSSQIAVYPVDSRGLLPRSSAIGAGGIDAAQPGLASQVADAFDQPAASEEPAGLDAMQRAADLTGGRAFINGNDLTGAIRDAVTDAAVLYSVGFYIDARSADGKFHELKVTVARSGVTLRYPRAYFAAKDAPSSASEIHNSLVTALRSPIQSSEIPLQAKIERVDAAKPNALKIRGVIDTTALHLIDNGKMHEGALDVTIVEQDASGKILSQSGNHLKLSLPPEQYAALLVKGISFEKHLEASAESVTLRIMVQEPATARVGSLIVPLEEIK